MASKLSGWIEVAVGAALVAGTIFTGGALSPALASFLISAGSGVALSGIGSLIAGLGAVRGTGTMTRNPVKPWDVVYGRNRVPGTTVYLNEWGNNNKYLDIVAVLACHPCQDVYAVLFNGRMVQIDTTAVPSGVRASTWPAINGGTSFSPVQETQNISSIVRSNNVITVQTKNFPLLIAGEYVIISGVTTDPTMNGTWPVSQITSQIPTPSPGSLTFTYICGGSNVSIGAQGTAKSTWVDYGRHVYVETMLGNQTLGTTFVGMTIGTPNQGNTGDLQKPSTNPWSSNCSLVGRTAVFIRLNYDDNIFANGVPEISFLVHGKNDIYDPRTSTHGYTENPALIIADYMTNADYGYRCQYGTEINVNDLITDANVCDEPVALAAGGTEPRYTCNGSFHLAMLRGEILQHLLSSCGGRLTHSAGRFRCNPAAWPGIAYVLGGSGITGWTPRESAINSDGLLTFDALAPVNDSFPYSATTTWPGTCNVINWAGLLALKAATGQTPAFVQGAGNASASGSGTFHTWTISFPSNNTAGNCLVIDVAFNTGYPLAGASVTDSQGNTYKPVLGGHVPGAAAFLMAFVAPNCASGANTLTITQTGNSGFDFQGIAVAIHEYSGLSASLPSGTPPINFGYSYTDTTGVCDAVGYAAGPDANTITTSVTVRQENDLLHLMAATLSYCPGVVVTGAAMPVSPLANAGGPFRWKSKVSVHDLFNAVKGTYISPSSNWQPTDFPPYMQDTLHGYSSDANLAADNNERRYLDIQLPFTISVAMAQRLAKIELLRRRNQGTGTFQFNLYGLQMAVLDVIAMNLAYLGWTNKLLEVLAFRFTLNAKQDGDQRVIALGTEIDVQETSPATYEWNTAEELTPQGYQQGGIPNPQNIASPTSVTLLSNATTSIVGADGVARSRIQVTWSAPLDGYATEVQIQFQVVASPPGSVWTAGPTVPVSVTVAYLDSVVDGTSYYVQIRSVNTAGIASPWSQAGPVTVGGTVSQLFTVNGA